MWDLINVLNYQMTLTLFQTTDEMYIVLCMYMYMHISYVRYMYSVHYVYAQKKLTELTVVITNIHIGTCTLKIDKGFLNNL